MLKRTLQTVGITAVLVGLAQICHAVSIGVNFGADDAGSSGAASLAPSDVAGVAAQANWNNANGTGGSISGALDDSGAATAVTVSWAADESWSGAGGTPTTGSGILMNSWISENDSSQTTPSTVTVTGIPYAAYDLYIYVGHDRANDDTRFTETGGAFTDFVTLEDVDGTTVAANPFVFNRITMSGGTGNYFRVDDLVQSSLNIEFYPENASNDRGPFAGLQIVEAGTVVFDPTMKITVDRNTGQIMMTNGTSAAVSFAGSGVLSAAGGLDPSSWLSISGNYDEGGAVSDDEWIIFADSPNDLSEGTLGTGSLAQGQSLDLGAGVWQQSPYEDLQYEYLDANTGETIIGSVEYEGDGVEFGDFNLDGSINALDWPTVRDGFNAELDDATIVQAYFQGDMNGDLLVDVFDLLEFKVVFEAANGAGSFDRMLAGVPEPSSAMLLALSLLGIGWAVRRRTHRFATAAVRVATAAWLAMFLAVGVASADLAPGAISGVTGTAFAVGDNPDFGDGSISRVLDGSGLTVGLGGPSNWIHNAGWPDNWQGGENSVVTIEPGLTPGAWFVANLGSVYNDLNDAYFWNVREGTATNRGTGDFDLYYAVSPSVTPVTETAYDFSSGGWTLLGSYSIPEGADGGGTPADAVIDLASIPSAQYIGFDIETNWGSDFRVGFAELQFINGPDLNFQLTLEVNTASGGVRILNDEMDEVQSIDYFEIRSPTSQLDSTGWSPLGSGTNDGSDWEVLGNLDNSLLAQFFLQGSTTFADQAAASLGNAYNGPPQGDLQFTYHIAGVPNPIQGIVKYVIGFNEADFNQDGAVDGDDFLLWQGGFGTPSGAVKMDGDYDNDEDVDGDDFLGWQANFGSSGGDGASAVPEPSTLGLVGLLLLGLSLGWIRRRKGGMTMKSGALPAIAVSLAMAATATASSTNDRLYRLGDDDGVSAGATVSTTVDSAVPAGGAQQNLSAIFGPPTYVNVGPSGLARPGAGAGELGVQFVASNSEYLEGARLGDPSTSASSIAAGGPLDYSGIANRGFQLWVYANSVGGGSAQDVVLDTNQHGLRIRETGTWEMRYNGVDVDSGVAVNTAQWYHVMVVRPFGPSGANNGARLYVDGVATAASSGGYNGDDDSLLAIGSNTGDGFDTFPGETNFFDGALDDLEMFVMGISTDTSMDYGTFNLAEDNPIVAAEWGSIQDGDIDRDDDVDDTDVTLFISNWRAENPVNGVQAGDINTRGQGDFNYDGLVNFTDWGILRANHPEGDGLNLGDLLGGAPEPSSGVLALLGLIALWVMRRCR